MPAMHIGQLNNGYFQAHSFDSEHETDTSLWREHNIIIMEIMCTAKCNQFKLKRKEEAKRKKWFVHFKGEIISETMANGNAHYSSTNHARWALNKSVGFFHFAVVVFSSYRKRCYFTLVFITVNSVHICIMQLPFFAHHCLALNRNVLIKVGIELCDRRLNERSRESRQRSNENEQ